MLNLPAEKYISNFRNMTAFTKNEPVVWTICIADKSKGKKRILMDPGNSGNLLICISIQYTILFKYRYEWITRNKGQIKTLFFVTIKYMEITSA